MTIYTNFTIQTW